MGRPRLQQSSDGWFSCAKPPKRVPPLHHRSPPAKPPPPHRRLRYLRRLFPIPQPLHTPASNAAPINTSHPTPSLSSSSQPSAAMDPIDQAILWYSSHPSTKAAYATDPFLLGKQILSYPPHPSKPGWTDRCYKCLVRGHDAADCSAPIRACARCLRPGHGYRFCPKRDRRSSHPSPKSNTSPSVLSPKGTISDDNLPRDRPSLVDVYLPQSADAIDDLRYLTKGVVLDAKLRPGFFCPAKVQAAVLTFSTRAAPFPLLHMTGERFLLLLEEDMDRD